MRVCVKRKGPPSPTKAVEASRWRPPEAVRGGMTLRLQPLIVGEGEFKNPYRSGAAALWHVQRVLRVRLRVARA